MDEQWRAVTRVAASCRRTCGGRSGRHTSLAQPRMSLACSRFAGSGRPDWNAAGHIWKSTRSPNTAAEQLGFAASPKGTTISHIMIYLFFKLLLGFLSPSQPAPQAVEESQGFTKGTVLTSKDIKALIMQKSSSRDILRILMGRKKWNNFCIKIRANLNPTWIKLEHVNHS